MSLGGLLHRMSGLGAVPVGTTHPIVAMSRQRRIVVSAVVALVVVGAAATPFAAIKLLVIPGYMTAFGTAMIVINLLLAALLFSKGSLEQRGDATRLGTAYLFVAVIFVPLVASFPGGIMPGSVIGTPLSSIWLWSFWHAGFGLGMIRYAWLAQRPGQTESLAFEIIFTVAAVGLLTVVSTSLLPFLPTTLADGHTLFSGLSGLIPAVILVILAAAFALVCRLGSKDIEQLSVVVAMAAAVFDVWLTYKGGERFSLGWYLSKFGSLLTSLAVLMTLLHEVTLLHRRAATANAVLEGLARELTHARDQSDRASQAKTRFLAGMSHELRTPLNGILGYVQLLNMEGGLTAAQSARVKSMRNAGTILLEVINSVLDLSQIEAGRLTLQAAEIDLRRVATECVDVVRPTAEEKALLIELTVAQDVPRRVTTDPTRLRQMLLNLLGNAVKYTPAGAVRLGVRLTTDGAALRFEVADTGPGISADHRHRLFQEFGRLDADVAAGIEGAGLGLALSTQFAALLGGQLGHVDNPGGGSVFWLELPLVVSGPVAPAAGAPPGADLSAVVPVPAHKLRVLVVDDIAMNRDVARSFLQAAGHEVTCAESGEAAVAATAGADFDVVLMDVRMPGMDGLEATRRIRTIKGSRAQVQIVAMTAQVFAEQTEECCEAGMDDHLAKPFTMASLLSAVLQAGAAGQERVDRAARANALTPAGLMGTALD